MNNDVSYLMISYNRCAGLLANLAFVYANDPNADIWVVDNASTDNTVAAVRSRYPRVRIVELDKNIGMPARNAALRQMTSQFVVLLDDDSHPLDDAISRSTAHMRANPGVATVVGRVELPNGNVEAPAMHGVMLGGASCVRLAALRDVGYFPQDFFRQAEEYDLSCRLWDADWQVQRFDDVRYLHNKVAAPGRVNRDVVRLDLKHNLIVAARYLPTPFNDIYWDDFSERYGAIMRHAGFADDIERVIDEATQYTTDATQLQRTRMSDDAFEAIFEHKSQAAAVSAWASENVIRRVAIADVSKNLFATYQACRLAGIKVEAIVDDRPAFVGTTYRKLPVISHGDLGGVDGVIVSNTNPAQVDAIAARFDSPLTLATIETLGRRSAMRVAA